MTRIAVLGAGRAGTAIARVAMDAGCQVSIAASGDPVKIELSMKVKAPSAEPRWAADAIRDADLVVLAIPLHRLVGDLAEPSKPLAQAALDHPLTHVPRPGTPSGDLRPEIPGPNSRVPVPTPTPGPGCCPRPGKHLVIRIAIRCSATSCIVKLRPWRWSTRFWFR